MRMCVLNFIWVWDAVTDVCFCFQIAELGSMRLLVRTSPTESLDRTPTLKCGIGYDLAVKLARSLGIVLNDLIYEAV